MKRATLIFCLLLLFVTLSSHAAVRTVVFMQKETTPGQDIFIKGGHDAGLVPNPYPSMSEPITYNNTLNTTTAAIKAADASLDWGSESALDWTTSAWPADWGTKKTYAADGYGEDPENTWGHHWWKFDVMMDGNTGEWFEFKAFMREGSSEWWESDRQQSGTPYSTINHWGKKGYITRCAYNENWVEFIPLGGPVNQAPTAAFSVSPGSGYTSTTFAVDGSASSDPEDGNNLQFRWDWDNDGSYDTTWSSSKTASHQYATTGSKTIKLEVKDSGGLTATVTKTVTVDADPGTQVTVHYKTSWGSAYLHYNDGSGWTAAPGVAMQNYRPDWYSKTVSRSGTGLTFVFNNGSGTWDSNGGNNYSTTLTSFWVKDGQIHSTDPEGPQPPVTAATPGGGSFSSATLTIALSLSGDSVSTARYTLDGSNPALGGTAYVNGTQITIGSGMNVGDSKTLRLYANSTYGTDTQSYTFTKVAQPLQPAFSWDNATVYFVMTDRFVDGNPGNNNSYGRPSGSGPGDWHGGDLAGLTQKLNSDYFSDLGVNAIWITCPFEQVHGWVVGGGGAFKHYGYHGYFSQDWTRLDQNMGTTSELQTFIDTAHSKGIRVIFDIVMNHAGYNTMQDMNEYNFGELYAGWEWATLNNFHDYINYNSPNWVNWWGPDWIRSGLPGYTPPGGDDLTKCLDYLPDFKTESTAHVGLPNFYANKSDTGAYYMPNTTVRGYLVKWLTDWVRSYGVDGFRCDTAKHVELDAWSDLKSAAVQALRDWKAANPGKKLDDLDFWMTGEVWGHGVSKSSYFYNGFDSVINFGFAGSAQGALSNPGNIEGTYSSYANSINNDPDFNVLSYLSSHDTALFFPDMAGSDANKQKTAGSLLLLCPGAVQVYYGDENCRPNGTGNVGADSQQRTRSRMPWPGNSDVLAHWQKVGQFRNRHLAVGAGAHQQISSSPYTFSRIKGSDKVVCVLGGSGTVSVNVSSVFANGTQLRNAYDGSTASVVGGTVSFSAGASGTILIEAVN